MRTIKYIRTEFHGPDEEVENDLLAFVYDIPYFSACGIFPPYHLINQVFSGGGGDGGMGPGAIWEPFEITEAEFNELVAAVKTTQLSGLATKARYCENQYEVDPQFNEIRDRTEWATAVCAKHGKAYRRKRGHLQ